MVSEIPVKEDANEQIGSNANEQNDTPENEDSGTAATDEGSDRRKRLAVDVSSLATADGPHDVKETERIPSDLINHEAAPKKRSLGMGGGFLGGGVAGGGYYPRGGIEPGIVGGGVGQSNAGSWSKSSSSSSSGTYASDG